MSKNIQKYAVFLNELRKSYNFNEDEFCEGICDPRSFRRYVSGERNMPHQQIFNFCDRLDISVNDFFYSFIQKDREEFQKINKLYYMLSDGLYDQFFEIVSKFDTESLVSAQNLKFYEFCVIKAEYKTHRRHANNTHDALSKLINYPECLKNKAYDIVEMLSLNILAEIEISFKTDTALNRLQDILYDSELFYLSSESRYIMPSIYANVSIYLGRLERYVESQKLAEEGIRYSLLLQDMSALVHLRYMRSYCLLVLGNRKEAEIEANKCLCTCIAKGSERISKMFQKILIKDFGYNPMDDIIKHMDILLKKD